MDTFICEPTRHARRNALLCSLALCVCMIASRPFAGVPYSDDFGYTKTALDFARTWHLAYNAWGASTLGWQAVWGALFIKLFGFSFNVVRLSNMPVAMASAYLFHQILIRFGINPWNAVVGTLALILSPLYLILAVSFMTDIPGLMVILLCLSMCQRAVAAKTSRATLMWLGSAAMVNLVGGSVRQIAWLGTLVMVPATAYLLRDRRGVRYLAASTTLISLLGIEACMHWTAKQPYFVPEPFLYRPLDRSKLHLLITQLVKGLLCLLLLLFPLIIGWLPKIRSLRMGAFARISMALSAFTIIAVSLHHLGSLNSWLMPWLWPTLGDKLIGPDPIAGQTVVFSSVTRLVISAAVVASALLFIEISVAAVNIVRSQSPVDVLNPSAVFWLIIPFSLSYLLFLFPRASVGAFSDRYLIGLMPIAIILLLLMYQRLIAVRLPMVTLSALAIFSYYAIANVHDFYAELRAGERAADELETMGVSRTSVIESFASDAWIQVQISGHLNHPQMIAPAGVYKPDVPHWNLPPSCPHLLMETFEPDFHPEYMITWSQTSCLSPTLFAPFPYNAWVPPFHRADYIKRLP